MAGRVRLRSTGAVLAACAAVALALPGAAAAQFPPAPTLILGGHLYPKPFGLAYVYGHAELPATADQSGVANQTIALYSSTFPYTGWVQVATLTTDFGGYFSYHQTLTQNTEFRGIWQGTAPVVSKDKLLKLPVKLTLRASHSRVKRGGVVTFTGAGAPAHPGARVELQKQGRFKKFRTFASTVLSARSTFNLRTRLKAGGVFRALFPGDDTFGVFASRPVRVTAVKKKHK